MPQLLALILALSCVLASAETVLWKATGTISAVQGTLQDSGVTTGTPVTIRMTYDDQALPVVTRFIPLGNAVITDSYFPNGLSLKVVITIGSLTWDATVETDNGFAPYTLLVTAATLIPPERITATLSSSDNTQFTTFPFKSETGPSEIALTFSSTTDQFIDGGISSRALDSSSITSASGSIQTGSLSNRISFTLDLSSIEILDEADEIRPLQAPVITASLSDNSFKLSWQSDLNFRYRIESTSDLAATEWDEVEIRFGTDTIITRTYPLTTTALFYRVVALERTPTP